VWKGDGGLASYGEDHKQIARRSAYLVDKIFKGTRPTDLPVEEPVTFILAVNLKAAAALGLTIPDAILARAGQGDRIKLDYMSPGMAIASFRCKAALRSLSGRSGNLREATPSTLRPPPAARDDRET
jgi:ABC transporter substrate binding protein